MVVLERILEPEVMDTVEEAAAYDAMDHQQVNEVFVQDLLATAPHLNATLDLGTGTGLVVIQLCRSAPTACVTGVDLSTHMLDVARSNAEAAGVMSQLRFERVDAKRLPYDDGAFQCVISNSIVHHIPLPATVLAEAVRVTARGGRLFFRDLMRPNSQADLDRLVETYTGDEPADAQQMFRDSLHAALSLAEIRQLVAEHGYTEDTVNITSDRHWTWSATKP